MQSKRQIQRRSNRNRTMIINFNPEEATNMTVNNEREDVNVVIINETSPIKIRIEDRQFDFLNTRALFEKHNITVNSYNRSVTNNDQKVTEKMKPNETKQKEKQIEKQKEIKPNETKQKEKEIKIEKEKEKQKEIKIEKEKEIKKQKENKEMKLNNENDIKLETDIHELQENDKKDIDDKKAEIRIKDHVNSHDKEVVYKQNINNDTTKDNHKRLYSFDFLKKYWKDKIKKQ